MKPFEEDNQNQSESAKQLIHMQRFEDGVGTCIKDILHRCQWLGSLSDVQDHAQSVLVDALWMNELPIQKELWRLMCISAALIWKVRGEHEHLLHVLVSVIQEKIKFQHLTMPASIIRKKVCYYYSRLYGKRNFSVLSSARHDLDSFYLILHDSDSLWRCIVKTTAKKYSLREHFRSASLTGRFHDYLPNQGILGKSFEVIDEETHHSIHLQRCIEDFQSCVFAYTESASLPAQYIHTSIIRFAQHLKEIRLKAKTYSEHYERFYFSPSFFSKYVFSLSTLLRFAFPTLFSCGQRCARCLICYIRKKKGDGFLEHFKSSELKYLGTCGISTRLPLSHASKNIQILSQIVLASCDAAIFFHRDPQSGNDFDGRMCNLSCSSTRSESAKFLLKSCTHTPQVEKRLSILCRIFALSIFNPRNAHYSNELNSLTRTAFPSVEILSENPRLILPHRNFGIYVCDYIITHLENCSSALSSNNVHVSNPFQGINESILASRTKLVEQRFERGDGLCILIHSIRMRQDKALPDTISLCYDSLVRRNETMQATPHKLWDLAQISPQSFAAVEKKGSSDHTRPKYTFPYHRLEKTPREELAFFIQDVQLYYDASEANDFTQCTLDPCTGPANSREDEVVSTDSESVGYLEF